MGEMSPKQFRIALFAGALVYAALMLALFGWLAFNGEATTQKRIEATPSATVSLVPEKAEMPSSWTDEMRATPVEPPEPEMPPEEKAEETTPEEKTEPEKEPEVPSAADEPPSSEEDPSTSLGDSMDEPAVTVNSVEEAKPAAAAVLAGPRPKWQRFARPFDQSDARPRIGLVITDLGFSGNATEAAVQELPGEVTLAFSSLAPDVDGWTIKARAAGHELLLTVPMEPENYPQNDPGPNTLLTSLPDKDNVSRLRWALSRADGFVAVMPSMGEKFVQVEDKMVPVLDVLREDGLMIVDNTLNKDSLIAPLSRLGKVPFVRTDLWIDAAASRGAIQEQLTKLEEIAKERGQAIGVAMPYPVTFEQLKPWIESLEGKGIVLAPLTALASEEIPVVRAAPAPSQPVESVVETTESLPESSQSE